MIMAQRASSTSTTLPLSNVVIAAMVEAANCLAGADDPETFMAALGNNHQLWQQILRLAPRHGWPCPEPRLTDFILATSANSSRRVLDSEVEALIALNRNTAAHYSRHQKPADIHRDAEWEWKTTGPSTSPSFQAWLLARLDD